MTLPIEGQDASQLLLKMLEAADYKMQATLQREAFMRHHPKIQLIRLDRTQTNVDELYRDAQDPVWLPPIEIHAHVEHSPSKQRLMKFGINEEREVMVTFSTALLSDAGVLQDNTTFLIGDCIKFDSDLYEIKSQHRSRDGYWGSSNIPFHVVCTCSRYQHGQ